MQNSNLFQFSYFNRCQGKGQGYPKKKISLQDFIEEVKSTIHQDMVGATLSITGESPDETYKLQQAFKAENFPCVTISGLFKYRNLKSHNLISHSNIICLDFDHLPDSTAFKQQVASMPFVLAAFISPRREGCKVLVRVPGTDHASEFLALKAHFERSTGKRADDSGKDICRLCFLSYDPDAYYNPDAEPFLPAAPLPQAEATTIEYQVTHIPGPPDITGRLANQEAEVMYLIEQIEKRQLDIASDYPTWRDKVLFPFADFFKGNGFPLLTRVSRFSTKFDSVDASRLYREAVKGKKSGRTISSFFQLCKEHGLYAKQEAMPAAITPPPKTTAAPATEGRKIPLIAQVEGFLNDRYQFRHNVVSKKIEQRAIGETEWNEANEFIISRLLEHNSYNYGAAKVAGLLQSDFVPFFNPITDYFNSLQYSPKEGSYIEKVCRMVKATDQARFNHHFRKMLIRCVACSTNTSKTNSLFNKHVFTIISTGQSKGKTSFTRWLCPPALSEYYTDSLPLNDRDKKFNLSSKFFINIDDFNNLEKQELNSLKALISFASINEREMFGKSDKHRTRIANFFASGNAMEFLTDTTGNVRWLCFEVEHFIPGFWEPDNGNFIDINKVWAEAKYLFDRGEAFQLTAEERNDNEEANNAHRKTTLEEELINQYCQPDPEEKKENHKSATEIIEALLSKTATASKINRDTLSKALILCGYNRKSIRKMSNPVYGYYIII